MVEQLHPPPTMEIKGMIPESDPPLVAEEKVVSQSPTQSPNQNWASILKASIRADGLDEEDDK